MAAVSNSHGSMYNGVTQQPPNMRSPSQCEEMYNMFPSIEYGLIRREPLQQPDGSNSDTPIMSDSDEKSYTQMIIDGNSVYQININSGVPYVVQLQPFYKVMRPGEGITVSPDASAYLKTVDETGYNQSQYATTTIKNTTLLVNQAVIPVTTRKTTTDEPWGEFALVWLKVSDAVLGIKYNITINGKTYSTVEKDRGLENKANIVQPSNISDDLNAIYPLPSTPSISLNKTGSYSQNGQWFWNGQPVYSTKVHIFKTQNADLTWTSSPWYNYSSQFLTTSEISMIQSYRNSIESRNIAITEFLDAEERRENLEATKDDLDKWLNYDYKHPTNTLDAVTELKAALQADGYSVYQNGSIMAIRVGTESDVTVSDSFGNSAMDAFHKEAQGTELLPSNMAASWDRWFRIKIKQENSSDEAAFWVKWNGKVWEETQEDSAIIVDDRTMPIQMQVQFYETGSIANVTIGLRSWDDRLTGDDITNEGPGFFNNQPIRDIFFYRNRIGFLTDNGVAMTESGQYSNVWRTTAISNLDSDPIDFVVSTTSSTALRYTIMNQDKIFILADNVQFVMDGGVALGPNSTKVTEVSHYILNLDVRPIVSNSKIIMLGGSEYSAIVYEYIYNERIGVAEATSLTAHVPGYILNNVVSLAASSEDNMIFVVAGDHRERLLPYYGDGLEITQYPDHVNQNSERVAAGAAYPERKIIYMYKHAESGGQRIQNAWSKWNYRGSVLEVNAARGMLYMDIDHEFDDDQTSTVIGTGVWKMTGSWDMQEMNWNMDEEAYLDTIQLQRRFARQPLRPPFLETTTADYEVSTSILDKDNVIMVDYQDFGLYINRAWADLGEFVYKDRASQKYTFAKSQLKAILFKSDPGSLHSVVVRNLNSGKSREIYPHNNKRFQGIGLAANNYLQDLGRTNVAGRNQDITEPDPIEGDLVGEVTTPGNSFDGPFDTARIANIGELPPAQTNPSLPHLYGVDVPVFVGGRSDSTRVLLSSYYDNDRDYGFRIHDIIQEANINARSKIS